MKNLKPIHYLIIGLILLLVVQYIWNKRDKSNLLESIETVVDEEKEKSKIKRDSLLIVLEKEIESTQEELIENQELLIKREEQLNYFKRRNLTLNNKLNNYEKRINKYTVVSRVW